MIAREGADYPSLGSMVLARRLYRTFAREDADTVRIQTLAAFFVLFFELQDLSQKCFHFTHPCKYRLSKSER